MTTPQSNELITAVLVGGRKQISQQFVRRMSESPTVGIAPAPYRSLPGSWGPESPKSLRRVSRGLPAPGSKKCPKQSRKSLKKDCFETPETLPRLSRTLFGPRGRKAPGDSSETLWGFRARRARGTPVRGGRDPNPTTTASQKSIAVHLPFVLQYASNLYCSAFGAPRL